MARPLRIEYPGACYHVMNRGNRREDIFITNRDRISFVDGLADSCEIYDVRLIGYVLMPNHFHFLLQTPQANLSEFMRHFLVTYTVRFNRRNDRMGHVFQGRFKSLLVEEDEYLLPLSRYIHLNPIRTSQFKDADFQNKSEYLKKYPWSTFPGYCYLRKRNNSIEYGWLLKTYFGDDNAKSRRQYREYVYHALESKIENPFEEVIHQSILGTQDFVEWVKEKISWAKEREVPALRGLRRSSPSEIILELIGSTFGVEPSEILNRKMKSKLVRQIAMELCYRYSPRSQRELGEIFGVDYSTVSQNRSRIKRKLQKDKQLREQFEKIEQRISLLSKQKI